MKKKLYALSGVFLIVLVVTGLWASKAGGFTDTAQTDPATTSNRNGVSMKEMVERSSLIAYGNCLETKSEWIGRSLVTLATVSVIEPFKGEAPQTLTVVLPGGVDSHRKFPVAMTYAGAPKMAAGEAVILFLVNDEQVVNGYAVVNSSDGKFSVVKDTDGEPVVARVPMKVAAPKVTGFASGNPETMKLSEFKAMIESLR
jgi:hypothetical protein